MMQPRASTFSILISRRSPWSRATPTMLVFLGNRELPIHIGSSVRSLTPCPSVTDWSVAIQAEMVFLKFVCLVPTAVEKERVLSVEELREDTIFRFTWLTGMTLRSSSGSSTITACWLPLPVPRYCAANLYDCSISSISLGCWPCCCAIAFCASNSSIRACNSATWAAELSSGI